MVIAAAWRLGGKGREKQEDHLGKTATVAVRGGQAWSHWHSEKGQEVPDPSASSRAGPSCDSSPRAPRQTCPAPQSDLQEKS